MSAPIAFQFDWRAKAGSLFETGRGLLSPSMKAKLPEIEEFSAAIGNLVVAAYPPKGEIHLDHHPVYRCPCRQPHKLIWFWRMGLALMGNGPRTDRNSAPPVFECYGFGLECAENKFGFRFLKNGEVQQGLE